MASLDSQLAITQARLEDSGNEVSSLGQRLILERNRLTELEAMLAHHDKVSGRKPASARATTGAAKPKTASVAR